MSGVKGAGLLLILAAPLGAFVVWQATVAVGADRAVAEPPAERGAPKEQLSAARERAAAHAAEVRKAAGLAVQYRAPTADDATRDPDAKGTIDAAAARAADLTDLDLFLSDLANPVFAGKVKDRYKAWTAEKAARDADERAVSAWFLKVLAVASANDATKELDAALALVDQYAGRSKFSDKAKAATWRVRARLRVADALATVANDQYRAAIKVKLPLEPGTNAVKTAGDTHRTLSDQIDALRESARQAADDKVTLDATVRAAVEAKGAVADECAARAALLKLFAKDDLFTNAAGAGPWLKDVAAHYDRTKNDEVRALIRKKVQEFCEAFIPVAARLDDTVLLKGKPVPRKDVVIKYEPTAGAKVERKPLSSDPDGLTEFNVETKHPGPATFVYHNGSDEYPRDLKPTDVSRAALVFNAARKAVPDVPGAPRWTAKTVGDLKKKCEPQKELVDQLQTPGGTAAPNIWTRLSGLAAGMDGKGDLFEPVP